MKDLIDVLLDVARIEAGAFVMRRSLEDLGEILGEVADLFESQAEAESIALVVEVVPDGEGAPPRARVDRDRVLQALANLVDNALRVTPSGGTITLWAREEEGGVAFGVTDTGPGVEPERIDHLFDRFWRADGGTGGSAGLGLTIVKGVAEAHGGEATVSSPPGAGATFTLRIPGQRSEDAV
ncbi:MAG: hypothetical protein KC656_30675 [Myxococcales bacterium]|nr:hypothetical protein [Myxococcales bacterium]